MSHAVSDAEVGEDSGVDDLTGRVVAVTEAALGLVREARSGESDAESLALWIEAAGSGPTGFTYDIYFSGTGDAAPDDWVGDEGGVTVVVPSRSIEALRGSTLDVSGEGEEIGLVMVNPNRPAVAEPAGLNLDEPGLDSDVAKKISALLEEFVNPSIASHGGRADLVAVAPADVGEREDAGTGDGGVNRGDEAAETVVAYLRLSGGCQGCAMSRATLSQGIEVAIRDAIPEVVGVVDVTDHSSGANPYF